MIYARYIHFGGAFPVGNFAEETGDGFSASPGFNVGVKGKIPLPVNGLGIFISGDFIFNGLKGLMKDYFDEMEDDGYDVKRPRYINVPIFVGLNYKYNFNPHFGIWAEGGFGADLRKITNWEESYTDYDYYYGTYTYSYKLKLDMQASFAGQIGTGIMINDLFSIGLHFYGLGASKIKGKLTESITAGGYTDSETYPVSDSKSYSQNCFMVRLGFHF